MDPNGSGNTTTFTSWFNNIKSDDIDGGLAADFDGSLSGLGAEIGSTTYNMSEALLALPVFKQESFEHGFTYILSASTSPATKLNEETLTYLNQGQSYEVKIKRLGQLGDLRGKLLKSKVRVIFHERRLQYSEKEQLDTWRTTRPGERILDIDIPLSYGLSNVVVEPTSLNTVEFVWDPSKEVGVYCKVNCISTEFTAKKHGGEKGVPFRLQVETYSQPGPSSKLIHCASCQIKVFKPKGADRKNKTDREKIEKRNPVDREKFQPSYECTVLTEIPIDQVESYLEHIAAKSSAEPVKSPLASPTSSSSGGGKDRATAAASVVQHEHPQQSPVAPIQFIGGAAVDNIVPQQQIVTIKPNKKLSGGGDGQSGGKSPRLMTSSVAGPYTISDMGKTLANISCADDNGQEVRNFRCLSDSPSSVQTDSMSSESAVIISPTKTPSKKTLHSVSSGSNLMSITEKKRKPSGSAAKVVDNDPGQAIRLNDQSSSKEVTQWLQHNRFNSFVRVFQNFSGSDLMRLSRDDLIQICGLADGIRLNNALQAKNIRPKLTLYVCQQQTKSRHRHSSQSSLTEDSSGFVYHQQQRNITTPSSSPNTSMLLQGSQPHASLTTVAMQHSSNNTNRRLSSHSSSTSTPSPPIVMSTTPPPLTSVAGGTKNSSNSVSSGGGDLHVPLTQLLGQQGSEQPQVTAEQYAAQLKLLEQLMASAGAGGTSGSSVGGSPPPQLVSQSTPTSLVYKTTSAGSSPILVQSGQHLVTVFGKQQQSQQSSTPSSTAISHSTNLPHQPTAGGKVMSSRGSTGQLSRLKGAGNNNSVSVKMPMSSKRQYRESNDDEDDLDESLYYSKKQRTRHLELSRKGVYHALYLDHLNYQDLQEKIASLFSILHTQVKEIYVQGPSGIQVLMTDEVVQNLTDNSRYFIEVIQDDEFSGISPEYFVYLQTSTETDE